MSNKNQKADPAGCPEDSLVRRQQQNYLRKRPFERIDHYTLRNELLSAWKSTNCSPETLLATVSIHIAERYKDLATTTKKKTYFERAALFFLNKLRECPPPAFDEQARYDYKQIRDDFLIEVNPTKDKTIQYCNNLTHAWQSFDLYFREAGIFPCPIHFTMSGNNTLFLIMGNNYNIQPLNRNEDARRKRRSRASTSGTKSRYNNAPHPERYHNMLPGVVLDVTSIFSQHPQRHVERNTELKQIDDFIKNDTPGYLAILGSSGTGKTDLIVEHIRRRAQSLKENSETLAYDHCYFFTRLNKHSLSTRNCINHLYYILANRMEITTAQKDGKARTIHRSEFLEQLRRVSKRRGSKRIVIYIDGIDEAVSDLPLDAKITELLPGPAEIEDGFSNVRFVLASRTSEDLKLLECHSTIDLDQSTTHGFLENIWVDLYSCATISSTARERLAAITPHVTQRADNNALYLDRLFLDLKDRAEHQQIEPTTLPPGLPALYQDYWDHPHYQQGIPTNMIRDAWRAIALLQEGLDLNTVCILAGISTSDDIPLIVQRYLNRSLYERTGRCELFHSSFAEFVLSSTLNRNGEVENCHSRILAILRDNEYSNDPNTELSDYCFRHLPYHAYKARQYKRALASFSDYPMKHNWDFTNSTIINRMRYAFACAVACREPGSAIRLHGQLHAFGKEHDTNDQRPISPANISSIIDLLPHDSGIPAKLALLGALAARFNNKNAVKKVLQAPPACWTGASSSELLPLIGAYFVDIASGFPDLVDEFFSEQPAINATKLSVSVYEKTGPLRKSRSRLSMTTRKSLRNLGQESSIYPMVSPMFATREHWI